LESFGFQLPKYGTDGSFGEETENAVIAFQTKAGIGPANGFIGPDTMRIFDQWAIIQEKEHGDEWDPREDETPLTINTYPRPLPTILKRIVDAGHEILWDGDYHLNLFGIRTVSRVANRFDDYLGVAFTENGEWIIKQWKGTTDPGTYDLENPMKVEGTAILVPGQYKDVWTIDMHRGKYEALCQRNGKVTVYRDKTRDNTLDLDPVSLDERFLGINIHAATRITGRSSTQVDKWSAGCQVHATSDGFTEMMDLANLQVQWLGRKTFTYTLLED